MDVLALFRTLATYKYVVLGITALTVAGMAYVFFGVPPLYEQSSSVVILQPRSSPSKADLKKHRSLASTDPYNPFAGDPSLIVGVVSSRLSADATRESFRDQGLDPNYEVAAALSYGSARPEMLITAYGSTPQQTVATREALTEAVQDQLTAVQDEQGVADYYMVKTLPVEPTATPKAQVSQSLRSVIAIGILGGIILFAVISMLKAWDDYRAERLRDRSKTDRRRSRHRDLIGDLEAPTSTGEQADHSSGLSSDEGRASSSVATV